MGGWRVAGGGGGYVHLLAKMRWTHARNDNNCGVGERDMNCRGEDTGRGGGRGAKEARKQRGGEAGRYSLEVWVFGVSHSHPRWEGVRRGSWQPSLAGGANQADSLQGD